MCMTYTTSQDEKAILGIIVRLQVNNTGYEMHIYTNHAVNCVRFTLIY